MTREQKDLLIKDISARLPYGVIGIYSWKGNKPYNRELTGSLYDELNSSWDSTEDSEFIAYLFPLSSMTDKDLIEFLQINGMNLNSDELKTFRRGQTTIVSTLSSYSRCIDWLNAHHFDYRGLIEKGLAIDATGLNIY